MRETAGEPYNKEVHFNCSACSEAVAAKGCACSRSDVAKVSMPQGAIPTVRQATYQFIGSSSIG